MKRIIFISTISISLIFCLLQAIKYVAPGSYPFAEIYEFNSNEKQLIDLVENFKKNNPQYNVPMNNLFDGRKDSNDYWFHVYLYYPNENELIYFWIRQSSSSSEKTEIGLVSINEGLILGNWKEVNDKFSRSENREIKKKFEERVLNKLGLEYKDEGNGMKIGFIQI